MSKFDIEQKKFTERAVRDLEKREHIPRGWIGRFTDAYGPKGERVHFSNGAWTFAMNDDRVSRHDSRDGAFTKAKKHTRL